MVQSFGLRVLANRQPSLRQASLLSFKPTVSPDSTTYLSPMNSVGYNYDRDGDTITLYAINSISIAEKSKSFGAESDIATHMPRYQKESIILPNKDALWGLLNILGRRSN